MCTRLFELKSHVSTLEKGFTKYTSYHIIPNINPTCMDLVHNKIDVHQAYACKSKHTLLQYTNIHYITTYTLYKREIHYIPNEYTITQINTITNKHYSSCQKIHYST